MKVSVSVLCYKYLTVNDLGPAGHPALQVVDTQGVTKEKSFILGVDLWPDFCTMVLMNQDWIEQDRARLRDIETYLREAEFLGLSDEEVATLENEANEIEGGLNDWATHQADLAHMAEHEPDYFYSGP